MFQRRSNLAASRNTPDSGGVVPARRGNQLPVMAEGGRENRRCVTLESICQSVRMHLPNTRHPIAAAGDNVFAVRTETRAINPARMIQFKKQSAVAGSPDA